MRSCYVDTIANQLSAKHLPWREYAQDMGNNAHRDGTVKTAQGPVCGHPALRGVDLTDSTGPANDSYATRHNPFMYFESVIGSKKYCAATTGRSARMGRPAACHASTSS